MTAQPDTAPYSFTHFPWQLVGGTPHPGTHTVAADSVKGFSKWAVGIPRPTISGVVGQPTIDRMYTIKQDGGSNFVSSVQLRYDATEIPPLTDESSLQLMRGPYVETPTVTGWNMVTLPVVADQGQLASIFTHYSSAAFSYAGSYQLASTLSFGKGYWLKFTTPQTTNILGDDREKSTLALTNGWNMVGGLSVKMASFAVVSTPPGLIRSPFFTYSGGHYVVADSIVPGRAYWVKAGGSGQLSFDGLTGGSYSKSGETTDLGRLDKLVIRDGNGQEGELFFGVDGRLVQEFFTLPPRVPEGSFDVRFADEQLIELASDKQERQIPIVVTGGAYPLTIKAEISSGTHGVAYLTIGPQRVSLVPHTSTVVTGDSLSITLHLAPSVSRGLPKEYALMQNYPNPFNPTTRLEYNLPEKSLVTLKVYDILGREVATVVQKEDQETGEYQVEFHGENLASGVYIYRLDATNSVTRQTFTGVRKMILMR